MKVCDNNLQIDLVRSAYPIAERSGEPFLADAVARIDVRNHFGLFVPVTSSG